MGRSTISNGAFGRETCTARIVIMIASEKLVSTKHLPARISLGQAGHIRQLKRRDGPSRPTCLRQGYVGQANDLVVNPGYLLPGLSGGSRSFTVGIWYGWKPTRNGRC